jgi:Fur family peroxide stress response transcriptional regulator
MQGVNNTDTLDAFIERCKNHNLKITPQRIAVYKALIKAKDHPTADVIYQAINKEFPNISFDTVNRTLLTFSGVGIIDIVEGHGDPRRFDPDTNIHHHFYCIGCGNIIDIYNEEFDRLIIPVEIRQKCTISSKKVVLKGFCDQCREEEHDSI